MKNLFLTAFFVCALIGLYLIYQNGDAPIGVTFSNRMGVLTLLSVSFGILHFVTPEDYQESDILDDNF
jgi:hypothetical protein